MKLTLLIPVLLAATAAYAQIPTTGLIAQYPFSGSANDVSGNGWHGTVMGATLTSDRFGNANSAYSFDGLSTHIVLPDTAFIGLNTYSYSLWFRPYSIPTNYSGSVYSIGSIDQNRDQTLAYQPGTTIFAGGYNIGQALPFQSKAISGPTTPNQWVHVVVTRDMTSLRMYVNGTILPPMPDNATNNQPANYGSPSRAVIGGRATLSPDSYFTGAIDDILHYNRVLTPAEVTTIFNESLSGNRITGLVFSDVNGNGAKDSTEMVMPQVVIQVDSANTPYGYSASNLNGLYTSYTQHGNYTVTIPQLPLYHTLAPASHSVSFTGVGNLDSLNHFALAPIPNMNDLRVTLTSLFSPRPGFDSHYQITYKNVGTTTLSGNITLVSDSLYNFLNSVPVFASHSNDTLTWNFANLAPGQTGNINVHFNLPATVALGDTLHNLAFISPIAGDEAPANNTDALTEIVIGSYDPNDKAVSPAGDITPQQVANAQPLVYTIRFQNTGTASAINVAILDTLSAFLNVPTFEVLSASHAYVVSVCDNTLEWKFNNIMLPDSNTNEPASHGFIKYTIRPKTNLVLNNTIENTAHIYFDFNAPITTNTTSTTVAIPTGLPNTLDSRFALAIYPNPTQGLVTVRVSDKVGKSLKTTRLVNMLGQTVFTTQEPTPSSGFEKSINLSNYPAGLYFLTVTDGEYSQTVKVIIQK